MDRKRMFTGLAIATFLAFILPYLLYHEFRVASAPAAGGGNEADGGRRQHRCRSGHALPKKICASFPGPRSAPVANMIRAPEDAVNRALITSVAENEPILESKLAPMAAGAGLSATIPEGMRALSAAVNDVVAVAGFVTPGAMVDVLATGSTKESGNITKTILENVRVLAANQRIESRNGRPENVAVITLLVTPADAAKLAMASNSGKIQLALRNTIDTQTVNPPPVLQASIYGLDAPPPAERHFVPAPPKVIPPPSTMAVEIIAGSKRETKTFASPEKSTGESNGQPAQTH